MICKHYYDFGDNINKKIRGVLDQSGWDIVRTDSGSPAFAIEESIQEYESNCRSLKEYQTAASAICRIFKKDGVTAAVSLGAGKAILEWNIKRMLPGIKLDMTDYTDNTIERLEKVFTAHDNIFRFDMMQDDYSAVKDYECCVMYRLSTEFSKKQWIRIFDKLHGQEVQKAVFIPTELASFSMMMKENKYHILRKIRKRSDIFCGWMYTENEFDDFWKGKYRVKYKKKFNHTALYYLHSI